MSNDPEVIQLGEYEVPDARHLLEALEMAGIAFKVEEDDSLQGFVGETGYGHLSRIRILVGKEDAAEALAVRSKCLKIEV